MSEDKKERTVESIHQEYSRLCAQAGHIQYQRETLKKDLEVLNRQLRDLNLEAAALAAKTAVTSSPSEVASSLPPSETI